MIAMSISDRTPTWRCACNRILSFAIVVQFQFDPAVECASEAGCRQPEEFDAFDGLCERAGIMAEEVTTGDIACRSRYCLVLISGHEIRAPGMQGRPARNAAKTEHRSTPG